MTTETKNARKEMKCRRRKLKETTTLKRQLKIGEGKRRIEKKTHNSTKWRWRMKKQKLGQFDNQRWRRCDDDERLTVRETAKKYTTIISIHTPFLFFVLLTLTHKLSVLSEWNYVNEEKGKVFCFHCGARAVILHSSDNFRGGKWLFNLNKMCFQMDIL